MNNFKPVHFANFLNFYAAIALGVKLSYFQHFLNDKSQDGRGLELVH